MEKKKQLTKLEDKKQNGINSMHEPISEVLSLLSRQMDQSHRENMARLEHEIIDADSRHSLATKKAHDEHELRVTNLNLLAKWLKITSISSLVFGCIAFAFIGFGVLPDKMLEVVKYPAILFGVTLPGAIIAKRLTSS